MQWPGASKLRSPIEHSQRILTLESIGCEAKKNATDVWPGPVYFNLVHTKVSLHMH